MKKRHGFVTNSSSTNDIFTAIGTAGAASAIGVIINTVQPDATTEIITYALIETYHYPEEPRPPVLRVNDSEYVVWYYACIRIKEVQSQFDVTQGTTVVTVLRDEIDMNYTSSINFQIAEDQKKWLTFANSEAGVLEGSEKMIGFYAESPYNDRPRNQRPRPPRGINIKIFALCNDIEIASNKQCKLYDEAILFAPNCYALNDSSVVTKSSITLANKGKYTWSIDDDIKNDQISRFCNIDMLDPQLHEDQDKMSMVLAVQPKGRLISETDSSKTYMNQRIDFDGKSDASHISDVWDYMTLTLIDEGLFHTGESDEKGNLKVSSFNPLELSVDKSPKDIPPTPFELKCIVKKESDEEVGNTAEFAEMSKVEINFDPILGTNRDTENLAQAYEYEVNETTTPGRYEFKPNMELPAGDKPYIVHLPVICEYQGDTYELALPINLIGEPIGPNELWEEEFRKLRLIIRKYTPGETWIDQLNYIEENKAKLSTTSLRLMRRSIWETARDELTREAAGYERVATICEWTEWGLAGVQWLGDQAFSYLMTIYAGPVLEMFITPFKEVMVKLLAELGADLLWNGKVMMTNEQIYKTSLGGIFGGFDNFIGNEVDELFSGKAPNFKKLGTYLAAFAAVKCLNHYICDTKPDGSPVGIWDAIIDTCKDLSTTFFKGLVGKKLGDMLKGKQATELFEKYASKWLKDLLKKKDLNILGLLNIKESSGTDVLEKYLTGIVGVLSVKAYGKVINVAGTNTIDVTSDDIIITVNISSDSKKPILVSLSMNQVTDSIIEFMFNLVFGSFPFALTAISVPENPKYFKK